MVARAAKFPAATTAGKQEVHQMQRIKSGILGLDRMIGGGFERGSLIEVAGGEGTFKSIFALQYAIQGIREREKVAYISLEEPGESAAKTAKELGWEREFKKIEFREMDVNGVLAGMRFSADVTKGAEELAKKVIMLAGSPDRLILDTATTLALYSSRTQVKLQERRVSFVRPSAGDIRIMLYCLADELRKKKGCTAMLLAESGEGELYLAEEVLKYICDAKIELSKSELGTKTPRSVRILKMRHTRHPLDEMPIELERKGLRVRKIEA